MIFKKDNLRLIGMFLVFSLFISFSPTDFLSAKAERNTIYSKTLDEMKRQKNNQDKKEGKEYIVVTKNERGYRRVKEDYGDYLTDPYQRFGNFEDNILLGEMTDEEAEALKTDPNVLAVEEDFLLSASTEREKTVKGRRKERNKNESEWNMQMIQADEVVESSEDAHQKVKVAVLDSGIDLLSEINVEERVNLVSDEKYVTPFFKDITGHGMSVAGIIAAEDKGRGSRESIPT